MRPIASGMMVMCLIAGTLSWLAEPGNAGAWGLWLGSLVSLGALVALRQSNTRLAVSMVTYFFMALPTAIFLARPEITGPAMTALAATLMISLSAFLLDARSARNLAFLAALCVVAVGVRLGDPSQWQPSNAPVQTIAAVSLLGFTTTVLVLFVQDERRLRFTLENKVQEVERVVEGAHSIARGDLRRTASEDGDGDADRMMSEMVTSLRAMVDDVRGLVVEVGSTSRQLAASSKAHASGASSQAAAVAEIGQTLDGLSEAATVVAEGSVDVVNAAERSVAHNARIVSLMARLGEKAERIEEVVSLVRTVADKVDMLALNAALEGVRAGDAGSGFTLVADELRLLAEGLVESLNDVQHITDSIASAARQTTNAATEGRELAERAAVASRRMQNVSAQQADSVRGAATATEEIARVAHGVSDTSAETLRASAELKKLADRLDHAVRRFRT